MSVRSSEIAYNDRTGVIARYGALLPITRDTPRLTLHEGATPLIDAPRLARWVGVAQLFLKFEGLNPTGSFKDRGMAVAVAKAIEEGAHSVLCASTGNTAASAAAYAARAGIEAVVLLPADNVSPGKMTQAIAHGARVLGLDTNFDGALELARALADRFAITLVNSVNPYRIHGQATAAYEVCDALGDAPDVLALPVGNGGNITAYWNGFRCYKKAGGSSRLPRMIGVQAAGAAPLVRGEPVEAPETVASAIRIGRPATWEPALAAGRESGGEIRAADDAHILEAYREAARREGIFCEPASAAGIAGLRAVAATGSVPPASRCVCVLTGHGLKDPAHAVPPRFQVPNLHADLAVVARELAWEE